MTCQFYHEQLHKLCRSTWSHVTEYHVTFRHESQNYYWQDSMIETALLALLINESKEMRFRENGETKNKEKLCVCLCVCLWRREERVRGTEEGKRCALTLLSSCSSLSSVSLIITWSWLFFIITASCSFLMPDSSLSLTASNSSPASKSN